MPNKSVVSIFTSLLVCWAPAALAQQAAQNFPDGPGKDTVLKVCGGCHDINRARAGYTPEGWNMLQHMMQNFETPIPAEEWPTVTAYLTKAFPERPRPAAVIIEGPVQASIKLWNVPTLGSRPHDPRRHQGRRDLVDRAIVEQARPRRYQDRRDPGIHAQDAAHRPARAARGQGRQHLVHRQPCRADRQARSENRPGHRIQDAGSEGEGSAQPGNCRRRQDLLHRAAVERGRPRRSERAARSSSCRCRRRARAPTAS